MVTQNSNTGNLYVTQNISTGNISATGNLICITGTNYMNLDTGLVQANATNLVLQTIVSSNQNVVLSANGTANATLSNTGNLTLSSGNLVTTYNVVTGNISITQNATHGNSVVTQNSNTGNLYVTTNAAIGGFVNTNGLFFSVNTTALSVTSTANQAALYTTNIANLQLMAVQAPSKNNWLTNPDTILGASQAYMNKYKIMPNLALAVTNVTCLVSIGGLSINVQSNSAFVNAVTNTTFLSSLSAIYLGANNSINSNAWIWANANSNIFFGSIGTLGGGGWFFTERFFIGANGANQRAFVGMSNVVPSQITGDYDPCGANTSFHMVGLAANGSGASGQQWNFVSANATAARNSTPLGATFPFSASTDLIELSMFAAPGGATIGYRVRNMSNGAIASGVITATANLPLQNAFLHPVTFMLNNVATASNIGISSIYLEKMV